MTRPPPDEDPNNRIVAVTLDEESIGRSGPDIEHERAIAIYDLIEKNLFAPEGAGDCWTWLAIDADTKLRTFKNELRYNEVAFR